MTDILYTNIHGQSKTISRKGKKEDKLMTLTKRKKKSKTVKRKRNKTARKIFRKLI